MKNIRNYLYSFVLLILSVGCASSSKSKSTAQQEKKPNIIYILADDLGYGDLSSYGQTKFTTPNIDALAESGLKFTQHYCGSAVCAPSRSSLMTGQHTGHTPIRGNKEIEGEGQVSLPAASFTIAELLKEEGYVTGAFGKWGLGFVNHEGDPNKQGFDEFFGYVCQAAAHRYYPEYIWHNDQKVFLEGNDWTNTVTYAPDVIQEATLDFIENNKDNTFFAYVPFILPHAELISPEDSILAKYKGKYPETAYTVDNKYTSDYGPNIQKHMYCSQEIPHAAFASMINRLDNYVGQIVAKVEELGIADETIIMFASDNGPHKAGGADPTFFNSGGNLRGIKRDLYEGGVRTPFIIKWPGKIKAGSTTDHVSAFWDILPTFADIVGKGDRFDVDGISFYPTMIGKGEQEQHPYLYWELNLKGGRQAVRLGDWKGVRYKVNNGNSSIELYNIVNDPEESTDVSKENPEVVKEIAGIMKTARTNSEMFPLFKGKQDSK
ncbi:arylsulfatase [Flammeovirga agarivorans]|uniref:Arylsulfatase n=1 Tax=Flammeovirga agarivorans TaxID=2726742 RepID=A0A7X8XXW0_9BACT|nr:arylsulfatase [Flammeovirga agarivorans]NLR93440.1 arylsulfatase [Flammeovirga agarivorans]